MSRPLLIIGASARAAAQSAHHAGFRVFAADLFADRDLREFAHAIQIADYPDEFTRIVRDLKTKHPSLTVMYTGAIENYPDVIAEIETEATLVGNSARVVRSVRDPFLLRDVLRRRGIAFPETRRERPEDLGTRRWLQKSMNSAGGLRVQLATENDTVPDQHYFQELIPGKVCSAAFIGDGAQVELFGVSEMLVGTDWLGGAGFKYCGSITRECSEDERGRWRAIGRRAFA